MKAGWAAARPIAGLLAGLIAFGIIIALLAAGIILLVGTQPGGEPIRLLPAPTPEPFVVQVNGEVGKPGVYSLPPGSRVVDAIQAAGGLLPQADVRTLNQAALIQDGELVWIPSVLPAATLPPSAPEADSSIPNPTTAEITPSFPIRLNSAGVEELQALPGIGPKLAQRIVDYRLANGPFASIEDIQAVDGIGPGIFEQIKDLIIVEG